MCLLQGVTKAGQQAACKYSWKHSGFEHRQEPFLKHMDFLGFQMYSAIWKFTSTCVYMQVQSCRETHGMRGWWLLSESRLPPPPPELQSGERLIQRRCLLEARQGLAQGLLPERRKCRLHGCRCCVWLRMAERMCLLCSAASASS